MIRPTGIFPELRQADRERAQRAYPQPAPEPRPYINYGCYYDHREDTDREFAREVGKGFVETFPSRAALEERYGKITPSRVAAIVKETPTGKKTRLIHDMSRSGVNQRVRI